MKELEKLPDHYLFAEHSKQTISRWVKNLNFFHFKRAYGRHSNDGDEFRVEFIFADREDLMDKMKWLGLNLQIISDESLRMKLVELGKSYTVKEFSKFKFEIEDYPDLEQPGFSIMFGYKVYVWIKNNRIQIRIFGSDDSYGVTETDFIVCMEIEKHFEKLEWYHLVDKSWIEDKYCVSHRRYPKLYY